MTLYHYLSPLIFFSWFLYRGYYSKNVRIVFTVFFVLLAWYSAFLYQTKSPDAKEAFIGFLLYSIAISRGYGSRKETNVGQDICFDCPFCEAELQYEYEFRGKSLKCPNCQEVVTVTSDPEVHREAKESYEAILAAMENPELQDTEGIKDGSIQIGILGTHYVNLNKKPEA
jgi:hypothetical protein